MSLDYETRKLTLQLVPSSCWYSNLRSILPNWSEVSYKVRQKCKCEICGAEDEISNFDAHEVWKYDDKNFIQSLDSIICVCKMCHSVIHFGHTQVMGDSDLAFEWYRKVNHLSEDEALIDIKTAFKHWELRSCVDWFLDEKQLITKVEQLTNVSCDIEKPINGRYYADISYYDKDEAKTYGAKWDNDKRLWYFLSKEQRDKWYTHYSEMLLDT